VTLSISVRLSAQTAGPSVLDLRTRALAAMDENDKTRGEFLFSRLVWSELSSEPIEVVESTIKFGAEVP
jgi:hypothetical protein